MPDYRTTDARTSSLSASPCVFASPRVIDGFSLAFCATDSSPPLHSSFYTDPSSGSYFVSNSSGWLFFVVKKEKKREKGKKRRRRGERERERDRYSIQGESSGGAGIFANIFRKRDSTSEAGTVQSVNRTAIKLSSFHRNHGWTKTAGPSSENAE